MPSSVVPSKIKVSFLGLPAEVVPVISYSAEKFSTTGPASGVGVGSLGLVQAPSRARERPSRAVVRMVFFMFISSFFPKNGWDKKYDIKFRSIWQEKAGPLISASL